MVIWESITAIATVGLPIAAIVDMLNKRKKIAKKQIARPSFPGNKQFSFMLIGSNRSSAPLFFNYNDFPEN